jgi:hypothetical protein
LTRYSSCLASSSSSSLSSSPSPSSSSPIARYLTTLFPHAHRPLFTPHQQQRHFGVMNFFANRTRESLRYERQRYSGRWGTEGKA